MKRRRSPDGISGVTEHLSVIFASQTVACRRRVAFTEKLRVLPRSNPNIIPHGSGHKSRHLSKTRDDYAYVFSLVTNGWSEVAVKRSIVFFFCCASLSNYATAWSRCVRRAGLWVQSQNKQDKQTIRRRLM